MLLMLALLEVLVRLPRKVGSPVGHVSLLLGCLCVVQLRRLMRRKGVRVRTSGIEGGGVGCEPPRGVLLIGHGGAAVHECAKVILRLPGMRGR
jgi:hypothetical protein